MNYIRVSVEVGSRGSEHLETMDAMVDTESTYTWIPRDVLERLGVVPEEQWPFESADGRKAHYSVAWVQIKLGVRVQPTIAVFGEIGSEPVLGVMTLQQFLLAVDPVRRRLIPVPGLLKAS